MELPGSLRPRKGQKPGIPYGYRTVCTTPLVHTVWVFADCPTPRRLYSLWLKDVHAHLSDRLRMTFLPYKARRQTCGALAWAVRVPARAHRSVGSYWSGNSSGHWGLDLTLIVTEYLSTDLFSWICSIWSKKSPKESMWWKVFSTMFPNSTLEPLFATL